MDNLSDDHRAAILGFQRDEITEYHVYSRLAEQAGDPENREMLTKIAAEERKHAEFWKAISGEEVTPIRCRLVKYFWVSKLFGLNFGLRLMEANESGAQESYAALEADVPGLRQIIAEEIEHEKALVGMIRERWLDYVGSMVLGLSDAIVELTGTLAGLSFALRSTKVVFIAGVINGIAAALSMAASEYLSTKSDHDEAAHDKSAVAAAVSTGVVYIVAVFFLVTPFILFSSTISAISCTIAGAIVLAFVFTYYISVAKGLPFWRRFAEMAGISLVVALISFAIGVGARLVFKIDI